MENYSKDKSISYYTSGKSQNLLLKRIIFYSAVAILVAGGIFYYYLQNKKYQGSLNQEIALQKESLKATYEKRLDESKKSAQELFYQGVDLAKKNLTDYAAITLEGAVEKDPKWRDLAYYTGYVYYQMAQNSTKEVQSSYLVKSKLYLEKARDIDPLHAPTYELLAQVYQNLGDEKNAEICYNKAKDFKK